MAVVMCRCCNNMIDLDVDCEVVVLGQAWYHLDCVEDDDYQEFIGKLEQRIAELSRKLSGGHR